MPEPSIQKADIAHHLHPFTDLAQHASEGPHIIESGEGIYLTDNKGTTFMDGMSSLWCCNLGYSEPRLIEAARRQLEQLPYSHTFRGRSHPHIVELSRRLTSLAPWNMSKAFFANSGSEANDSAIKIAWHYYNSSGRPKKRKIIARKNGYHGSTIGAASLSGLPYMHDSFSLPIDGVLFTECPHYHRNRLPGESADEYSIRLADDLEQLILSEDPDTIAAFIAEPVMGVGGVIVPPESYFDRVQTVLRKYEILSIADEVICVFGRTGNLFGSTTFGFEPDMVTCAKGLSSAYFPVSALLVSDAIYMVLQEHSRHHGVFSHGLTYSGHPVGAAVALEVLDIYAERDIISHVRQVGGRMQAGLRDLLHSPIVGEVRGVGLMGAVELADARATTPGVSEQNQSAGERMVNNAMRHGLFVRAVGNSVVLAPPLIITDAEVDELIARFTLALEETAKGS